MKILLLSWAAWSSGGLRAELEEPRPQVAHPPSGPTLNLSTGIHKEFIMNSSTLYVAGFQSGVCGPLEGCQGSARRASQEIGDKIRKRKCKYIKLIMELSHV